MNCFTFDLKEGYVINFATCLRPFQILLIFRLSLLKDCARFGVVAAASPQLQVIESAFFIDIKFEFVKE